MMVGAGLESAPIAPAYHPRHSAAAVPDLGRDWVVSAERACHLVQVMPPEIESSCWGYASAATAPCNGPVPV